MTKRAIGMDGGKGSGLAPDLPAGVSVAPFDVVSIEARIVATKEARDSLKNLVRSMARAQAWADHLNYRRKS